MKRFIFAVLLLAAPLLATDRFFGPTGNDANPGTMARPFLTPHRALNVWQPGDRIWTLGRNYKLLVMWDVNDPVFGVPPVATTGDTVRPTVTWVTPNNASFYGNDVSVRVIAKDNVRVVRTELYRAGNPNPIVVNGETQLPNTIIYMRWQSAAIAPGTYTLTAYAYDANGNRSLPATVTVIRK